MVKNAALATSVYNKATCWSAEPKNNDIPITILGYLIKN